MSKAKDTKIKEVSIAELSKGDEFSNRRGRRFKVLETEVKQSGEFHGEPREQYLLRLENADGDVTTVTYMDTDRVVKHL